MNIDSVMSISSIISKRPYFLGLRSSFSSLSSELPSDQNLVSAAVSILKHQRSKTRWSYLRSLLTSANEDNSTGLTPSQFSEIALLVRNDAYLALRFFSFTVHHSLCPHSLSSYATMIHIFSRSRLKTEAQRLIHTAMVKFPASNSSKSPPIFETLIKTYRVCDSAPFVFDLVINACIESKRVDQSITIVRMLMSKSIFPKSSTRNALIELVSKTRGCFAGYELYKDIFWVDRKNEKGVTSAGLRSDTFNVIMIGFYREGLVERVEEIWGEMVKMNCVPNVYTYAILMASYCDNGRIEYATRIWEEMHNKGVKCDIVAYNTIIGGFCQIGEVSRAEEIFREMVSSGVESTSMTFKHLISGYCMIRDVDSVLLLYNDMCRKGFTVESSTVDDIIEALCIKNKASEAFEILKTAEEKHNVFPKRNSFVLLIKGLCQEGKMREALELQAEMVGKGYEPDEEIYNAFIDGHMKQGSEELAERLRTEMSRTQTPCGDD